MLSVVFSKFVVMVEILIEADHLRVALIFLVLEVLVRVVHSESTFTLLTITPPRIFPRSTTIDRRVQPSHLRIIKKPVQGLHDHDFISKNYSNLYATKDKGKQEQEYFGKVPAKIKAKRSSLRK